MESIAKKFIKENEENKVLYRKSTIENDKNAHVVLNQRFKNCLFKIHATSYLHKSIVLNARELKIRHLKICKREELTLNTIDLNFKIGRASWWGKF